MGLINSPHCSLPRDLLILVKFNVIEGRELKAYPGQGDREVQWRTTKIVMKTLDISHSSRYFKNVCWLKQCIHVNHRNFKLHLYPYTLLYSSDCSVSFTCDIVSEGTTEPALLHSHAPVYTLFRDYIKTFRIYVKAVRKQFSTSLLGAHLCKSETWSNLHEHISACVLQGVLITCASVCDLPTDILLQTFLEEKRVSTPVRIFPTFFWNNSVVGIVFKSYWFFYRYCLQFISLGAFCMLHNSCARTLEKLSIDLCRFHEACTQDSSFVFRLTPPPSPPVKFHLRMSVDPKSTFHGQILSRVTWLDRSR